MSHRSLSSSRESLEELELVTVGSQESKYKYFGDDEDQQPEIPFLSDESNVEDGGGSTENGSSVAPSSAVTAASTISQTYFTGKRLSAIDRIPVLYYMLLLLGVPVIIIIITQAIYMDTQLKSINFFHDHADIVEAVTHCSEELRHEAVGSTQFLITPPGSGISSTYFDALKEHRTHSDSECNILQELVSHSKLPKATGDAVRAAQVEVASLRAHIDIRSVTAIEARERLVKPLNAICLDVFGALGKAEELVPMRGPLHELMLTQLWQNWMSVCRAAGISVLSSPVVSLLSYREVDKCAVSSDNFESLFRSIAISKTGERYLAALDSDPKAQVWKEYLALVHSRNSSLYGHLQEDDWIDEFTYTLDKMLVLDHEIVHEIEDADALHRNVNSAAIQMSCYVAACVLTTAFVTMMQRRFQHRMDFALAHSRSLNKGVQRFVPRNQLKLMGARSIMDFSPGDHVEIASTMLFSDIRQFTTISEKMSHTELFQWLQSYFASMTRVVVKSHGFVEKFIGDALFCVFNNPVDGVKCGIAMHRSVGQLNLDMISQNESHLLHIGVGIHHGVVSAGVYGDANRLTCTLLSADVNLASRLEAVTKTYGATIIVSETVMDRVDRDGICHRCLGEIKVDEAATVMVKIYEIFQNDEPQVKELKEKTKGSFEKAVEIRNTEPVDACDILQDLLTEWSEEELPADKAVLALLKGTVASPTGQGFLSPTSTAPPFPSNRESFSSLAQHLVSQISSPSGSAVAVPIQGSYAQEEK